MKIDSAILNILKIPEKFYYYGENSIYTLLQETGYYNKYEQIDENNILSNLMIYPECISFWLRWSYNKRSDSGWYIKKIENEKYCFEYFPIAAATEKKEYLNIETACAAFIKKEIEDIRMN